MKQIRLTIDLTLIAPILTQASTAGKMALDAPFAKLPDLRCFLPFSLIKGRLRQSWDELSLPDTDLWFGNRKGGWQGSRGRFRFSDFEEEPSAARATEELRKKTGERHRIRIDEERGAADEGALQFIESPFPAGERVTFRGQVTWFDDDGADTSRQSLLQAFRWTGNFGAGRTIGCGRVHRVETPEEEAHTVGDATAATVSPSGVYQMTLTIGDPFCLARKRIDENLFSSDQEIPGSVVRGILATTLNRLLKRDSAAAIEPGDARGTEWNEIADHLNAIRFSHSFPAVKDGGKRPVHPPLSLVRDSGSRNLADVALCEGPVLINGAAPAFSIDWKGDEPGDLLTHFDWPALKRTIRTRTAIDRDTKRAEASRLFSYEMIDPAGIVWIGTADFSAIDDATVRAKVIAQFERIFAMQPAALGKTKSRLGIQLTPADTSAVHSGPSTQWVVTLQTPALLCDPSRLDEASGRDALFAAYASAWADVSNEQLQLVRFFASQSLTGGYLTHRFNRRKSYAPFLLTDPGSVFVLSGSAAGANLLKDWRRTGLPLPKWARTSHGETWQSNPYLPADGFGEIAVDLPCHTKHPPMNYALVDQWPAIDPSNTPPPPDAPPHDDKPLETKDRKKEDTAVGTVKRARFSNRWRISGRITTESEFHLGSGEITTHPDLFVKEKGSKTGELVEISAVAVNKENHPYIPGSSLKGVLRSWARPRFDQKLVDAVFGGDSDDPNAQAGKAEFHDAMSLAPSGSFETVPYWRPERRTGVVASAAIDRWTRTAQDKKLFHYEVVPPGVAFDVSVTAHDLSNEEASLLLQAMRAFGNASDPIGDLERATLGAETRGGLGRFSWSNESIDRLTDPTAWAIGWDSLPKLSQAERDQFAAAVARTNRAAGRITIPIDISFDGPFLVNEPSRTNQEKGDGFPNYAPRIDRNSKVSLPVSSLRGALRAQAERIARSVGIQPLCHSTDPRDACPPVHGAGEEKRLCVACSLFGATGWASPIAISTPESTGPLRDYEQELVAIDRFTGGVAGSAKFKLKAFWKPAFHLSLSVDSSLIKDRPAALGLLALTLRDLEEGDITLGFGASKGLGACSADVRWPAEAQTDAWIAAFRAEGAKSIPVLDSKAPREQGQTIVHAARADVFHNPYAFVPVVQPMETIDPLALHTESAGAVRHDKYVPGTYSGRIICRLETKGPVIVGAAHVEHAEQNLPADIEPFLDPDTMRPAIPSTSLRGLISSLAETASSSALRVLNERTLSYRCSEHENLPAIGMIAGNGKRLRPLALPLLRNGMISEPYRVMFSDFKVPPVRVYLNGYRPTVAGPTEVAILRPGSFLAARNPNSSSADNPAEVWYMRLGKRTRTGWNVTVEHAHMAGPILLAQDPSPDPDYRDPIDAATYAALPAAQKELYTRGVIRVLGAVGRASLSRRKHELFIPLPPPGIPDFDASAAVAEFERLAAERTEEDETLPYEPKGSHRNDGEKQAGKKIKLRDGDIVYFAPTEDGTKVERVAISSIWRKSVPGTIHEFFRDISPELLPFNGARREVTVAESIFGYVDDGSSPDAAQQRVTALAGRVRFSMARLGNNQDRSGDLLPQSTIQPLLSPKPPSPTFYFRPKQKTGSILKRQLSRKDHTPQGRKFYLHGKESWRLEGAGDRFASRATPIARGRVFWFHVDAENLTPRELGLLFYSLRPSPAFNHKIGMGKAIGLGSIQIDPVAMFLIDRDARYSGAATRSRYNAAWADETRDVSEWQEAYPREAAESDQLPAMAHLFETLRDQYRDSMNPDISKALELIGDPTQVVAPVHTPQIEDAAIGHESFKWFMRNEKSASVQWLDPLGRESTGLPVFSRKEMRVQQLRTVPAAHLVTGAHHPVVLGRPEAARPKEPQREVWPKAMLVNVPNLNSIKAVIRLDSGATRDAWAGSSFKDFESLKLRIKRKGELPASVTVQMTASGKYEIVELEIA